MIYLSAGEDVQVSGGGEREATGSGFSSEKWLWKEGLYIPDASFLDDNIVLKARDKIFVVKGGRDLWSKCHIARRVFDQNWSKTEARQH